MFFLLDRGVYACEFEKFLVGFGIVDAFYLGKKNRGISALSTSFALEASVLCVKPKAGMSFLMKRAASVHFVFSATPRVLDIL